MKLRDDNPTLEPAVERELEALEAALAGEPVPPEHADLAALAQELSELRPGPGERFAAELDSRAAAGFGGRRPGRPLGAAWQRFRSAPLRRQLAPAAASALGAIVIATAVVASGGGDGDQAGAPGATPALEAVGGEGSEGGVAATAAPPAGAAEDVSEAQAVGGLSTRARDRASIILNGRRADDRTGPFASGERRRFVERSARLTLGTEPERVQGVADEVFGVVGGYDGIVLSSAIRDGREGEAGARFELLIPSPRLGGALADLSGIAEVRAREESTLDITAPTVTVQERLRDARAEAEGLLKQLAEADTDEERAAVKAQLAFQRQRVAALRAALNALERRANLSRVSLDVVTGDAASFGPGGSEWTLGDALRDAGRILAVAAGVTLIALAVLAPIALIALLAWLTRRTWIRHSRERALEG